MRFGLMAAAALAAAGVAAPASAANILVQPRSGSLVVTSGTQQTCTQQGCTTVDATVGNNIFDFVVDVPNLNGTVNFGPISDGPNSNAGVYNFTGFLTFAGGNLVTDRIDFTYYRTVLNGTVSAIDTRVTGYVTNFQVRNLDTGQLLAPVPEPGIWVLMVLGMGAVGFAMRRRKNVNTTVRFA